MSSTLRAEHLRYHLTDGHWHDRCHYCLDRRRAGGTGVTEATAEDGRSAAALEEPTP